MKEETKKKLIQLGSLSKEPNTIENVSEIKHGDNPVALGAGLGSLGTNYSQDVKDSRSERENEIKKSYAYDFVNSAKDSLFKDPKNIEFIKAAKDANDRKARINKIVDEAFLSSEQYKRMSENLDWVKKPYEEREQIVRDREKQALGEQVGRLSGEVGKEVEEYRKEFTPDMYMSDTGTAFIPTVDMNSDWYKEKRGKWDRLQHAQNITKDTQRIYNEAIRQNRNPLAAIGRGVKDKVFDVETWNMGVSDLDKGFQIKNAAEKFERGEELTKDEQLLLDALAENLAVQSYYGSDVARQYGWGEIAGEALPFMAEFALNPVAGTGKGLAKSIAKYGIQKFAAKGIGKTAIKAGARAAGDVVGALGMTVTSGAARTGADALERMQGVAKFDVDDNGKVSYTGHEDGEGIVPSLMKSIGASTIEYQSEMLGASGVGKLLGVKAKGFGKFFGKMNNSDLVKNLKGLEKRAQWSGVLGEYGEEAYNTAMNSLVIGDQELSDFTDIDKQVDTFMGLALMGGAMSGVNTVGYATDRIVTGSKLREADKAAGNYLEGWDKIKLELDEMGVEDRSNVIKEVLKRNDISIPAKNAFSNYVSALTYKDSLTSSAEEIREQNRQKAEVNGDKLYHSIRDKRSVALQSLSTEKRTLEAELGDLTSLSIDEIENSTETTPEILDAVQRYDIVKKEYQTIQNRLRQEVDEFIEPQIKAIDNVTREDGAIIEINLGDELFSPDIWYVMKGNISLDEETGRPDESSDKILYVVDGKGRKRQIATSRIQYMKIDNAKEQKQAAKDIAYQQFVAPLENQENGIRHFEQGEQVEFYNDKGETVAGTVATKQGDTVTIISNDGKNNYTYEESDLNNRMSLPSLGGYRVRDQFDIMLDGDVYPAEITDIADGQITVYIPGAPDAAQRFMDVGLDQLNSLRGPLNNDNTSENEAENESVPGGEQNIVQPDTENQEQNVIAAENAGPVSETPPFIDQVPKGEKGEMLFEQAEPETTIRALREVYEDADELDSVVDATISKIQKQIRTAKAPKPTGDISKDIANKQAAKQQVVELNKKLEYWEGIKEGITPKPTTYEERISSIEQGSTKKRDSNMGEYLSLRDFLLRKISTGQFKFRWNSGDGHKGLVDEILTSKNTEAERKKRISFLNNKGYTPVSLAEEIAENAGQGSEINPGWFNDVQDIRNEINDILLSYDTPTSMIDAATDLRRRPETSEEYGDFVDPELISQYEIEPEEVTAEFSLPFEAMSDDELSSYFDEYEESTNFEEKTDEQRTGIESDRTDVERGEQPAITGGETRNSAIDESQREGSSDLPEETGIPAEQSTPDSVEQPIEENAGNDLGRPSEQKERSVISYLDQKLKEWENLYHEGAFDKLVDDPLLQYAGSNKFYSIPFSERIGFKFPDETTSKAQKDNLINELTKHKDKSGNIRIVDYSDKAIAVYGDTKGIKDQLKVLGGRFNPKLKDGAGWIFPKSKKDTILSLFNQKNKTNFAENVSNEISDRSLQEEQRSGDEVSGQTEEPHGELRRRIEEAQGNAQESELIEDVRHNEKQELRQDNRLEQERKAGRGRNAEAASRLGSYRQVRDSSGRETAQAQEDELRRYAQENGIWLDTGRIAEKSEHKFRSGKEADVYLNPDGDTVTKIINYAKYSATPLDYIENRVLLFNELFDGAPYTIIGFTETDKGFSFVVEQPFIKGLLLENPVLSYSVETYKKQQERVAGYMRDKFGMESAGLDAFSDGNISIQDVHLKNVIQGEDGNLYVIDAITTITEAAELSAEIEQEAAKVDQNPTEAQKEAGNYQKGHINVQGFDITIENPKGSTRSGTDASGKEWSIEMQNHYGYFKRTEGKDGDHIDVFVGENPASDKVFVIDQIDPVSKRFDESKVMLGFDTTEEAQKAYLSNYEKGWQGMGTTTAFPVEAFKKWLYDGARQRKPFSEYKETPQPNVPIFDARRDEQLQRMRENEERERKYGAENKIISKERYEELRKQMKGLLNNMNMGFNPEILSVGAQLAMYHIEAGARSFKHFAMAMIDDFGDGIRPYLKSFYEGARFMPGMEEYNKHMDTASDVKSYDVNNIEEINLLKKLTEKKADNKQLSIFEENTESNVRVLQTNSKRLPQREQTSVLQGTGRSERTGGSGDVQGAEIPQADGGQRESEVGQGSVLPGDADVLKPALVEFEVESNDTEKFNKKNKYADNISAIETVISILKEKRKATPEEKNILSKYVGFGGLKEILLDSSNDSAWKKGETGYRESVSRIIELAKEFDEVAGTDDTLQKIRGSIVNAHYTSQTVINAIYKGLKQLGFKGGNILEPSAGIGNFISYMPESVKKKSNIFAVELDNLTGNILKTLHDNVHVQVSGIENASIAPGSQDLVISNVPFGNYKVYDRAFKGDREQFLNRIHNYFFAKALDQVRDGGLVAFVTSKGVLDSPGNSNLREYLNKNAEFLGAVRLPNTTFKNTANTEVVTDVVFLRKTKNATNPDFVNVSNIEATHKDGEMEIVTVNQYFIDNPQNMLGEIEAGGLYSRDDYTLKDNGAFKNLDKVIKGMLPSNIYSGVSSAMGLQANDLAQQFEHVKEGNIAYSDGELYRKEDGVATPVKINEPEAKIKDYIDLRNSLMELIYSEYAGYKSNIISENRQKLNDLYDNFVKKYGKIGQSITKIAKVDADGYNVLSLDNNGEKADIFSKRTINPISIKTHADTLDEAIVISLSETAGVDIERIAQLLGKSVEVIKEESKGKLFERPEGGFVTRDEYLSGNVKQKLKEAKQAVEGGFTEFQFNVDELERVIPADIPAVQIEARLGSRWIPASVYSQFAKEILNDDSLSVSYSSGADQYFINGKSSTVEATKTYGTSRVNGTEIILSALHINPPKVYDYYREFGQQKRELNKEETDLAVQKYQEVRDLFEDWVYKAPDRRDLLSGIYNEKFNTSVRRKYNGEHLTVPGINDVSLRDHQKDAIWMLLQNGGGVIDHLVGAGKTYVMVAGTMEMKRTGVAKKPMIMALKSTIPQIVETYRAAYPMAKILAPMEKDFEKENRLKLFSKIANNEWDVIIMSHENYGKIPHERDIQERLINQELEELEKERYEFEMNNDRAALKGLEIRIKNLNARLDKLADIDKDNSLTFEQMGIDHLMIDESQQFKNLSYITKQRSVAGLGNAEGSKRAFNLLTGIRYLQEKLGGDKGATFLSGTPITNSIVEMYSLLNYLRPSKMAELGFTSFDAWATTFANPTTDIEFTVTGNFKQKTRFREFMNVPELSMLYTEIADIRTDDNLKLDKPTMKGKGYSVVDIQMSDDQKEFSERLMEFAETKDGKLIGRGELSDNEKSAAMLLATNLSSKMAIDMRLVDSSYGYDPNGKIAKLVENVTKTYNETSDHKGTQLIFSDLGTPKNASNKSALLRDYLEDELGLNLDALNEIFGDTSVVNYRYPALATARKKMIDILEIPEEQVDQIIKDSENSVGSFDVYNEVKKRLIEKGIPEEQVVFIHDYNTSKKKEALFNKVNEGQIRIVLGSTQKLGTGVNVQERIVAVHHIDVPWTPASMEQRNGRALRQGNRVAKQFLNNELPVYAYATERTLDAYKYQLLQTKQTFLNQVKSGEVTDRVIKEGDGDAESGVGYAELVAMLSGNQDILKKSKLEEKLARLKRAKRNFDGDFYEAQSQIEKLEEHMPFIEENIKKSEENVKLAKDFKFEDNKLVIESFNGKQSTKKEKDKVVPYDRTDYAKEAIEYIERKIGGMDFEDHGKIDLGGYEIEFYPIHAGNKGMFSTDKKPDVSLKINGVSYTVNFSTIPGIFLNNIQKAITDQISNVLNTQRGTLERNRRNLASYKEIIERGSVWPKQGEYDETVKELKEVTDRIDKGISNPGNDDIRFRADLSLIGNSSSELESRINYISSKTGIEFTKSKSSNSWYGWHEGKKIRISDHISKFEEKTPYGRDFHFELSDNALIKLIKGENLFDNYKKGDKITHSSSSIGEVEFISYNPEKEYVEIKDKEGNVRKIYQERFLSKEQDNIRIDDFNLHDKYESAKREVERLEKEYTPLAKSVVFKDKESLIDYLRKKGANKDGIKRAEQSNEKMYAVYFGGEILLNADAVDSALDIKKTWVHETMHVWLKNNPKYALSLSLDEDVIDKYIPVFYRKSPIGEKIEELLAFASEAAIAGYPISKKEIKTISPVIDQFIKEISNGNSSTDVRGGRGRNESPLQDNKGSGSAGGGTFGEGAIPGEPRNENANFRAGDGGISDLEGINDYNGFISKVFSGLKDKSEVYSKARAKGMDIKGSVEEYLSGIDDPKELDRVRELSGVTLPDNAFKYLLWKNANPNDGSPEWKAKDALKARELDSNILFRKGTPPNSLAFNEYEQRVRSRYNRGFRSLMFGIEEGWFDRMNSLRILQEAIGGKNIHDKANAYLLENQLSSRSEADVRNYMKNMIDPMYEAAVDIFGKNLEMIDNYLIAKHGLERNEYMARQEADRWMEKEIKKLNLPLDEAPTSDQMEAIDKIKADAEYKYEKLLDKDYSGLTALAEERDLNEKPKEAAENIVKELEDAIPAEKIGRFWETINNATKWMLDKQYESGMMTKEAYNKIRDMYKFYVPLRGFDETTATDLYDYILNEPSDFNSVLKNAKGRTSKSESPFASIMNMAESGILQSNRNKMKQAFYRLVATNPSNMATIQDVWLIKQGDDWVEKFPEIPENATPDQVIEAIVDFNNEMEELSSAGLAAKGTNKLDLGVRINKAQASEHVVRVWIGGEEKVIFINGNPRAAQAINGLTNDNSKERSKIAELTRFWMRQMSANFTSRNPAFMVTNFMRDIQFALVSAAVKEGGRYSAQLAINAVKVPKTIALNIWGNGGGGYDNYWKEFISNGGETGYSHLHTMDYHRKYVDKRLRELTDQRDLLLPFRVYVEHIGNANRLIEDISRFSTYVTSRQAGRSIERSVVDAKDITINFNRKGSGGFGAELIHTLFLFANPALQSLRQMGMLAKKNPKGFTAALAISMGMGAMIPLLNDFLINMFGDDDDTYWNLPEWTRRNHLVLYTPWLGKKRFVTLALPHELRGFYGIGEMAYNAGVGRLRHENIPLQTTKQLANMLPIDPTGGKTSLIPDIFRPMAEAYWFNRNFMDRPIYKDTPWNKFDPDWTKAYKGTSQWLVEGAKWLNEVSGGDDVVKGKIDMNPAQIQHVFGGYAGGAWTTYRDLVNVGYDLITGDGVTVNQMPVVNKLVRQSDDRSKESRINNEYFFYLDWMKDYEHKKNGYKGLLGKKEYEKKYRDLLGGDETAMYQYAKVMAKIINNLMDKDKEEADKKKVEFVNRMWELEKVNK